MQHIFYLVFKWKNAISSMETHFSPFYLTFEHFLLVLWRNIGWLSLQQKRVLTCFGIPTAHYRSKLNTIRDKTEIGLYTEQCANHRNSGRIETEDVNSFRGMWNRRTHTHTHVRECWTFSGFRLTSCTVYAKLLHRSRP